MNIGSCCTLAAKIQSAFYDHKLYFYCIQPLVLAILTSIFRRNLTLPFSSSLVSQFIVLFVSNFFALNIEQFEE